MLNKTKLKRIYEKYGFHEHSTDVEDIVIFSIRTGHYHNADIIPLHENASLDNTLQQYQQLGFACQTKSYKSIEEVELALFSGFFNLKATRKRLLKDYEEFTDSIVRIHSDNAEYSYINTQYFVDNKIGELSVTQEILNRLDNPKPTLFLVEAAAGFGKTCSAYELVKEITESKSEKLPLFSELSRNRQAKIFRYVLLDEIDRSFPLLSSSLVRSEIKTGKVPVVLDGFDELLHETILSDNSSFESTEPMLETISELLTEKAKVVLTTRRTAILDGDQFHEWMNNHENDFDVIRLRIQEPCIDDWLPLERLNKIREAGFPIENLSNPVLLSFLRCISDDEFKEVSQDSTLLVDKYFDSMMQRERKRQDLIMEPKEQYSILKGIASDMIEYDYTSEEREYIYSLILEKNQELLEKTRRRYQPETRPTTDELINKLTSHALLDRKGKSNQGIGFVNEFVLGNFSAECIIEHAESEWAGDQRFITPAIISYLPRSKEEKEILWDSLSFVIEFLNGSDKLNYSLQLTNEMKNELVGETVEELSLNNNELGANVKVLDTVFIGCKFTECTFYLSSFENTTFINCDFYDCQTIPSESVNNNNLHFVGCSDNNGLISNISPDVLVDNNENREELDRADIYVLEKFYPKGSPTFFKHRAIGAICSQNKQFSHYDILQSIEKLKKLSYLSVPDKRSFLEINIDKIGEIKSLLGKAQ